MGEGGPRNIFRQTMARQLPNATYSEHMSAHISTETDRVQEHGFDLDDSIDFSREDYINDTVDEENKITINLPLIINGGEAHQHLNQRS